MLSRSLRCVLLALFSTLFLLNISATANACSCGPRPTVLASFDGSDEVVVVRVLSVDRVQKSEQERYVDGVRSTTMIVEKVFKGKLKVRDEIVFGQGGGADCIWTFKEDSVGQQFLFYLDRPENVSGFVPSREPDLWFAFGCGRSSQLDGAADDLLYLENMNKVRGKTRISGTLSSWQIRDLDVSGKTIKIIGPSKTYLTKTDKDGVFEIYDVPPGKYFIEPELSPGWKIDPFMLSYSPSVVGRNRFENETKPPKQIEILLQPKKHAGVDILLQVDNFVRGRVLGPNGTPMPNVCVLLTRDKEDKWGPADCTDEQGRFEIKSIPPDDYVLVANNDDRLSDREPFHRIFYPSVSDRERAVTISVGLGETIENLDIVIPKLHDTITIRGVLRYSDGKLVDNGWVKFKVSKEDEKLDGGASTKTDKAGRFTLRVLKGLTGELAAEEYLIKDFYKNCPRVNELVEQSGRSMAVVQSNTVKLTAEQNMYGVELTFPFPFCEKSKE